MTLQLDEPAFAYFNALRQAHFPANINYLDAHLTLFHHLPNTPAVSGLLEEVAVRQSIISLEVSAVIKLGRGVAYKMQSPALTALQEYLKQQWQPWLTPQNRQGFRPHITIQNKVEVETANQLYEELAAAFSPFTAKGVGLSLWEYRGGPWHKVRDYNFRNI
ncbi:2'-5' RNA ligase family protein [Adhaeribacter aerolatus]|uniref:2'-5' RNA ligase family protein n=1 Tax=Adhaeribacter aerolatus TaxID=670289 RepID=UPI001C3FF016|nr:2'-5' RNA ligase family protein [Adhaeribacter aerolatus]